MSYRTLRAQYAVFCSHTGGTDGFLVLDTVLELAHEWTEMGEELNHNLCTFDSDRASRWRSGTEECDGGVVMKSD